MKKIMCILIICLLLINPSKTTTAHASSGVLDYLNDLYMGFKTSHELLGDVFAVTTNSLGYLINKEEEQEYKEYIDGFATYVENLDLVIDEVIYYDNKTGKITVSTELQRQMIEYINKDITNGITKVMANPELVANQIVAFRHALSPIDTQAKQMLLDKLIEYSDFNGLALATVKKYNDSLYLYITEFPIDNNFWNLRIYTTRINVINRYIEVYSNFKPILYGMAPSEYYIGFEATAIPPIGDKYRSHLQIRGETKRYAILGSENLDVHTSNIALTWRPSGDYKAFVRNHLVPYEVTNLQSYTDMFFIGKGTRNFYIGDAWNLVNEKKKEDVQVSTKYTNLQPTQNIYIDASSVMQGDHYNTYIEKRTQINNYYTSEEFDYAFLQEQIDRIIEEIQYIEVPAPIDESTIVKAIINGVRQLLNRISSFERYVGEKFNDIKNSMLEEITGHREDVSNKLDDLIEAVENIQIIDGGSGGGKDKNGLLAFLGQIFGDIIGGLFDLVFGIVEGIIGTVLNLITQIFGFVGTGLVDGISAMFDIMDVDEYKVDLIDTAPVVGVAGVIIQFIPPPVISAYIVIFIAIVIIVLIKML